MACIAIGPCMASIKQGVHKAKLYCDPLQGSFLTAGGTQNKVGPALQGIRRKDRAAALAAIDGGAAEY